MVEIDPVPKGVWYAGADINFVFEVIDTETGGPQNMTGWELTYELKDSADVVLVTKTVGSGITIGDGEGTGSRATVVIQATDTQALTEGLYHEVLRRTDNGSKQPLSVSRSSYISRY